MGVKYTRNIRSVVEFILCGSQKVLMKIPFDV